MQWKPSRRGFIKDCISNVKKLRQVGHEQVLTRLKMIQEGDYETNDLLSVLFKIYGFNFKVINIFCSAIKCLY